MSLTILCLGDIHMGRLPAVPWDDLEGLTPRHIGPVAAWQRAVNLAVASKVDAVLLAGDVVDCANDLFESMGPLESGVRRLREVGIEVLAVAGNHDTEALPRLARHIPHFRLVGQGGRWELVTICGGRVRVLGRSFASETLRESPLLGLGEDIRVQLKGGAPVIGLLHADLDAPGSAYGPVSSAALQGVPTAAWLLGHVHKPSNLTGFRPMGYLGSIEGLDVTETGPRGPWLLTVAPAGVSMRMVEDCGSLRWENADVPIDGLARGEEIQDAIIRATTDVVNRVGAPSPRQFAIGLRIRLAGRSPIRGKLRSILAEMPPETMVRRIGEKTVFVDGATTDGVLAEHDLEAISRGSDPPAAVAARLLEIQSDSEAGRRLVAGAAARIEREARRSPWGHLAPSLAGGDPADWTRAARELLFEAGFSALDALLDQKKPD